MKRKFKRMMKLFAPVACLSTVGVPLCVTLTSCSNTPLGELKSLNLSEGVDTPLSLSSSAFINDPTSIVDYLNGNSNFHEGNYCIILGSNVSETSNKWFCGVDHRSCNYYEDDAFVGGAFADAYSEAQAYKKNNDCEVLTFIDIQTKAMEVYGGPTIGERLFPFDYKWTESEQKALEKYNEEHKDEKPQYTIKAGEYARNDDSAKAMRWLVNFCTKLFGTHFGGTSSSTFPYVMTWKKGVPQANGFSQLKQLTDFKSKVIDIWEKKDEEK